MGLSAFLPNWCIYPDLNPLVTHSRAYGPTMNATGAQSFVPRLIGELIDLILYTILLKIYWIHRSVRGKAGSIWAVSDTQASYFVLSNCYSDFFLVTPQFELGGKTSKISGSAVPVMSLNRNLDGFQPRFSPLWSSFRHCRWNMLYSSQPLVLRLRPEQVWRLGSVPQSPNTLNDLGSGRWIKHYTIQVRKPGYNTNAA